MSAHGDLRLGFIALADSAPLLVAEAMGFFEAEGLGVTLSREASWATIRDKVALGALDGAHMLGPMPLASRLGAGMEPMALCAPMALNRHGAAITVSPAVAAELQALDPAGMAERPLSARAVAGLVAKRRGEGAPQLTFAVVFRYSMHNYLVRYWLAQAGIDPDRDVRLVVAPPARMVALLESGEVDGFCVGSPWGEVAEAQGAAKILIRASEIWPGGPDKVLGVSEAWAERNGEALQAMLRALIAAAAWADEPENRPALARLLARPEYVDAPEEQVARSLGDIVYHRNYAGFPWPSHAAWFLSQMLRWGQIERGVDVAAVAARVYRPDLFRDAAAVLRVPTPLSDGKVEDGFFDGRVFDPTDPDRYAGGFEVTRSPLR